MNRRGKLCFLRFIFRYFLDISKADFVIISTEDHILTKLDPFTPINSTIIYVHRTLLNIVASRLKKSSSRASVGAEEGDMKINHHFINVAKNIKKQERLGHIVWYFDLWLSTCDKYQGYRQDFLNKLNLSVDIQPSISHEGGGSSFSGMSDLGCKKALLCRHDQVHIPNEVRSLLLSAQTRELLEDTELAYLLDY